MNTPVSAVDVGRSKYHDYYLDATTFERWEYVYDASNMLVEVIAPDRWARWPRGRLWRPKGTVPVARCAPG